MFEKTLIVVYKDELLKNQLKKMVETHDDNEQGVVGTRDDSISIVSWTEKRWLEEKKAGNIQEKILFLDEIKGANKDLIPLIDVKFDECGVKFGWSGKQAVVYADPKVLTTRKDYDTFLKKLFALPVLVPDCLKSTKVSKAATGANHEVEAIVGQAPEDATENVGIDTVEIDEKRHKKVNILKNVKKAFSTVADVTETVGTQVASKSEEVFRNKLLMKRQMLFYGVVILYYEGLEEFMNNEVKAYAIKN